MEDVNKYGYRISELVNKLIIRGSEKRREKNEKVGKSSGSSQEVRTFYKCPSFGVEAPYMNTVVLPW